MLPALSGLRKLHIKMDEDPWSRVLDERGIVYGDDTHKIQGLDVLHEMRGLNEVVFEGNCSRIAALLKMEMEKPKLIEAPGAGSRKRKRGGEAVRKQPKRAAKATRLTEC